MQHIRGFTLLNLLIGMVISSVGILALLSLYRGMTEHSVLSLNDAGQNGQQTLGILAVQMELQRAGFGIQSPIVFDKDNTTNKLDFLILEKAVLESASNGDTLYQSIKIENGNNVLIESSQIEAKSPLTQFAIIWRYRDLKDISDINKPEESDSVSFRCAGLMAQGYGLTLLKPVNNADDTPYACASAFNFQDIHWTAVELISEENPFSVIKNSEKNKTKLIFKDGIRSDCWPFGNTTAVETIHFNIEVKSSFSTASDGLQKGYEQYMQSFDICLPNLQSTSGT